MAVFPVRLAFRARQFSLILSLGHFTEGVSDMKTNDVTYFPPFRRVLGADRKGSA